MANRVKAYNNCTSKYYPAILSSYTLPRSKDVAIFYQPAKHVEHVTVVHTFNRAGNIFFLAFGKMKVQRCPGIGLFRRILKTELIELITQNRLRQAQQVVLVILLHFIPV